jgi:hypothetical protein
MIEGIFLIQMFIAAAKFEGDINLNSVSDFCNYELLVLAVKFEAISVITQPLCEFGTPLESAGFCHSFK